MTTQDTSTVAPNLIRAVAEATQPFGPFLQGSSLHALEVTQLSLAKPVVPTVCMPYF